VITSHWMTESQKLETIRSWRTDWSSTKLAGTQFICRTPTATEANEGKAS
jgi:hypothetical protein